MKSIEQMIEEIRAYSNNSGSSSENLKYSDEFITRKIKDYWASLYYMIVKSRNNWYVQKQSFDVDSENIIQMPSYYKLMKVDRIEANYRIKLDRVDLRDENLYQNRTVVNTFFPFRTVGNLNDKSDRAYYTRGISEIVILPKVEVRGRYEVTYVPSVPEIPLDTLPQGFEMLIILQVAEDLAIPSDDHSLKNLGRKRMEWQVKIKDWLNDRGTNLYPIKIGQVLSYEGERVEDVSISDLEHRDV